MKEQARKVWRWLCDEHHGGGQKGRIGWSGVYDPRSWGIGIHVDARRWAAISLAIGPFEGYVEWQPKWPREAYL